MFLVYFSYCIYIIGLKNFLSCFIFSGDMISFFVKFDDRGTVFLAGYTCVYFNWMILAFQMYFGNDGSTVIGL